MRLHNLGEHANLPAFGRELDGVSEKVPKHLLEPAWVTADRTRKPVNHLFQSNTFRFGCGLYPFHCRVDKLQKLNPLDVKPHFAGDNSAHV
jgi:hypothetical protein